MSLELGCTVRELPRNNEGFLHTVFQGMCFFPNVACGMRDGIVQLVLLQAPARYIWCFLKELYFGLATVRRLGITVTL